MRSVLLRAGEHERGVGRERGHELQVLAGEGVLVAAVVEVDEAGRGPGSQGHGENGADPEPVGAARPLESRLPADVGGEQGEAALPHVAQHGQAERPLLGRAVEIEGVGRQRPPGVGPRRGEDAGPLRPEVGDHRLEDAPDHLAGLSRLEDLPRDLVEGDEAARGQGRGGERARGIEGRLGVGSAIVFAAHGARLRALRRARPGSLPRPPAALRSPAPRPAARGAGR